MTDWKTLAQIKRDSVKSLIPKPWLLPFSLPPADQQRDITRYIQNFLTPQEVIITETDAVGIVQRTTSGLWKSVEVAEAFCHRAALAHQMV
jgi:amidase